jgi:hypothetical protein
MFLIVQPQTYLVVLKSVCEFSTHLVTTQMRSRLAAAIPILKHHAFNCSIRLDCSAMACYSSTSRRITLLLQHKDRHFQDKRNPRDPRSPANVPPQTIVNLFSFGHLLELGDVLASTTANPGSRNSMSKMGSEIQLASLPDETRQHARSSRKYLPHMSRNAPGPLKSSHRSA